MQGGIILVQVLQQPCCWDFIIKIKRGGLGWWGGAAGLEHLPGKPDDLSSMLGNRGKMEREKRFYRFVLWLPHMCHGMYTCRCSRVCIHTTHTIIVNVKYCLKFNRVGNKRENDKVGGRNAWERDEGKAWETSISVTSVAACFASSRVGGTSVTWAEGRSLP